MPSLHCLSVCLQVELHDRRGDPIPEGWGCDSEGVLTPDPQRVLQGGGLVPIGGSEATGQSPDYICLFTFFKRSPVSISVSIVYILKGKYGRKLCCVSRD